MSEDTESKNECEPLESPDSTAQALRDEVGGGSDSSGQTAC
jgi:hypothetical protein